MRAAENTSSSRRRSPFPLFSSILLLLPKRIHFRSGKEQLAMRPKTMRRTSALLGLMGLLLLGVGADSSPDDDQVCPTESHLEQQVPDQVRQAVADGQRAFGVNLIKDVFQVGHTCTRNPKGGDFNAGRRTRERRALIVISGVDSFRSGCQHPALPRLRLPDSHPGLLWSPGPDCQVSLLVEPVLLFIVMITRSHSPYAY